MRYSLYYINYIAKLLIILKLKGDIECLEKQ